MIVAVVCTCTSTTLHGIQDCDEWELEGPRYLLALIILLHACTRIYNRHRREAYSHDLAALTLGRALVEAEEDLSLSHVERLFLCLPFLDSEHTADQALAQQVQGCITSMVTYACIEALPLLAKYQCGTFLSMSDDYYE